MSGDGYAHSAPQAPMPPADAFARWSRLRWPEITDGYTAQNWNVCSRAERAFWIAIDASLRIRERLDADLRELQALIDASDETGATP